MSSSIPEARRQLAICNACRYCEGYCAVFPALERRRELDAADLRHLANLCHDCRACLYACMYAPPHEFAVNIPALLSTARLATYAQYAPRWRPSARTSGPVAAEADRSEGAASGGAAAAPSRPPSGPLARHAPLAAGAGTVTALVLALAAATRGLSALGAAHLRPASPYSVVAYPAIVSTALAAFVLGLAVSLRAALGYLRDTGGSLRRLLDLDALWRASGYAATLRHLSGGGESCHDVGEWPSAARRYLHLAVSYGFGLCLLSTVAAAVSQDLAGQPPPYPLVSVPVLSGLAGGVGLLTGCAGLIVLKARSDPAATTGEMLARDYGLLVGLLVLSVTGLLTLAARSSAAYGALLVVHLSSVLTCFVVAPCTKFVHGLYRYLAILTDCAEARLTRRRAPRPTASAARPVRP